ncbi:hypothetical protein JW964_01125 [candidate division KSB1 bacterium]|nr:hypothetical protein [candidate division KSB1 bacterium]
MQKHIDNFDIRKISWAPFPEMLKASLAELEKNEQDVDNIRLENILIAGSSDLAEVNLGVLLGFRTENGFHVRFKSKFENRDLFVRVSAQLALAERRKIPVTVGGSFRQDGSIYAIYFKIENNLYNFLEQTESHEYSVKRLIYKDLPETHISTLFSSNFQKKLIRFPAQILGVSGLGSDYAYVLLGCIVAPPGSATPQVDVVFSGRGKDRDKFIDLNADLNWACKNHISVEFGGHWDNGYCRASYFKINPDTKSGRKGSLVNLHSSK